MSRKYKIIHSSKPAIFTPYDFNAPFLAALWVLVVRCDDDVIDDFRCVFGDLDRDATWWNLAWDGFIDRRKTSTLLKLILKNSTDPVFVMRFTSWAMKHELL
jgi:hypothetical protein